MLHEIYLPFSENILKGHFVKSAKNYKYISKFKKSIENYKRYEKGEPIDKKTRLIRQIEKDETFWTASSLMTIFYSKNRDLELKKLLILAYGKNPPLNNISNWDDCINGELNLFFEANIPSSKKYLDWLKRNVAIRNFIPYIIEKSKNKKGIYRSDLEGATNVDALLINSANGFSVFIEAKVLSDISYQVSYDSMRNQIARNIDVMLDANSNLNKPLNKRLPDNSLFLLLTPQLFKDNPRSRLYGYIFNDYKNNPQLIGSDLSHRNLNLKECENIAKRIGWVSWENLKQINNNCCKWIETE